MSSKIQTAITEIRLNAATFHREIITPTLINFFFGNNGTGKSTISRAIKANIGLTFEEGRSFDGYDVLVYNQDFVAENFESYGDLPGVYTIGETNVSVQREIEEKEGLLKTADESWQKATTEKARAEGVRSTQLTSFQGDCWDKTKTVREQFRETQTGKMQKATFTAEILTKTPVEHNREELRQLYDAAYGADSSVYNMFAQTGNVSRLQGSNGNQLMAKVITSSTNTPFAEFIKALGDSAFSWVSRGHEQYHNVDGKCPYCQRPLPDDFEENLAACVDEQFQQDLDELAAFREAYRSDMEGFIAVLLCNLEGAYPKLDLSVYKAKVTQLDQIIQSNIQKIDAKIKEPSAVIALDEVKTIRDELNQMIDGFNTAIKANNDIVNDKRTKKTECKQLVWEHLAFMLKGEADRYHKSVADLDKQIRGLAGKITEGRKAAGTLSAEISDLNDRIVSTEASKNDINNRLRDSGFQGFRLDDNPSAKGTYRVIRENGDVAENLSEGERNFIAFLYFYHNVRGGQNPSELGKPKIVVIDDPVSSMDSSVLFIVSTLVREMIEVCRNNDKYEGRKVQGEYIKQLFVLTHNAYFHKVITYNKSAHQDYPCVSFFMVKKASNVSTVTLCQRKATDFEKNTTMVNVNPVQNSYAALWGEYREVDTIIPLQAVIRRILEYYFLQICGHDGDELHEEVLVKNREKFIMVQPNGSEDRTKYDIASAMLTYLGSRAAGIGDGLHYVDGCDDIKMHREVFKLIFDSLGQSQHYKMMLAAGAGDSTTTEEEISA